LRVVIPGRIAWKVVDSILEHGGVKRGYLGIAGQPVALPEAQRQVDGRGEGLLVVGVTAGSPAAEAGVLVGDVMLEFDGHAIASPEDLLELLQGERVGRRAALQILRGTSRVTLTATVGERPAR
jgi:S1-C subfamily serine protease